MKMIEIIPIHGSEAKKLRKHLGMNQKQFWESVGATQANGSRYELGKCKIPRSTTALLRLYYMHKINFVFNFSKSKQPKAAKKAA